MNAAQATVSFQKSWQPKVRLLVPGAVPSLPKCKNENAAVTEHELHFDYKHVSEIFPRKDTFTTSG